MNPNQMLKGAFFWARQGLKVIPLHSISNGKCTCSNRQCKSPAKHPMVKNWQEWATIDTEKIRQFWQSHRNANVGVVCSDGLHVLDADVKDDGPENLAFLEAMNGKVKTLTIRTGGGGIQKYFSDKSFQTSNKTRFDQGLDWKTTGGYVVAPPSIHKSGRRYAIVKDSDKNNMDLSEVPNWLKKILKESDEKSKDQKEKNKKSSSDKNSVGVPEGGRNSYLTAIAGILRSQGLSLDDIRGKLHAENQMKCDPPLDPAEVETIILSILKYPNQPMKKDWEPLNKNIRFENEFFKDIQIEMLPPSIRDVVIQKSRATGLPMAVIAVPVMTTFSALLGSAFSIKPDEKSDHSVFLNLWGLLLAESGSRKTSGLSLAEDMIHQIENEFEEIRNGKAQENSSKKASVEAEIFILKEKLKKESEDSKKKELAFQIEKKNLEKAAIVQVPKYLFFTSESTPESLAEICNVNKRGVMYFRDELDGFFKTLIKQNHETLRAMLNEAWNGGKAFRLTRIGRGISDVEQMTISILGAIQPEVLIGSFREEMKLGHSGDGLLARFQLPVFYRSSDLSNTTGGAVDEQTKSKFLSLVRQVHENTVAFNFDSTFGPINLVLQRNVGQLYEEFMQNHTEQIRNGDFSSSAYRAHYSKLPRLLLSLAGQFHVLDCLSRGKAISTEVDETSFRLALKWTFYFDTQAQHIYSIMKRNHVGVKTLMKKVENGEIRNNATVRSIYRKNWSGLHDKEDVLDAIEFLTQHNWVHVNYGSPYGGGRRTELLQLHPDLIKEQTDKTDKTDEVDL